MAFKEGDPVRARRGLGNPIFGHVDKGTRGTVVQVFDRLFGPKTYKVQFSGITLEGLTEDDIAGRVGGSL